MSYDTANLGENKQFRCGRWVHATHICVCCGQQHVHVSMLFSLSPSCHFLSCDTTAPQNIPRRRTPAQRCLSPRHASVVMLRSLFIVRRLFFPSSFSVLFLFPPFPTTDRLRQATVTGAAIWKDCRRIDPDQHVRDTNDHQWHHNVNLPTLLRRRTQIFFSSSVWERCLAALQTRSVQTARQRYPTRIVCFCFCAFGRSATMITGSGDGGSGGAWSGHAERHC